VRSIHTEISIAAPAQRVWGILTAFEEWAQWNPFARVTGRAAVGERLEVEVRPPGKAPMTFRPTIVKLEPGQELRWLGHLGFRGLFDGEHGFRVSPEDDRRCRFEQFEVFRGLLVRPILSRVEAQTRLGFLAMNRALRAKAEAA
jgi:hypothetical protein